MENDGTVTPGVNGVPGFLTIMGDYVQESDGSLVINIDSQGNCGNLDCMGSVSLAGSLVVNKNTNYQPPAGTELMVLNWMSGKGNFSSINISNNSWINGGPVEFQPNSTMMGYELNAQFV